MNLRLLSTILILGSLVPCACRSATTSQSEAGLSTASIGEIYNVHAFGPHLLAGQPTAADFALLRSRGVEKVVTLRMPQEVTDFDEEAMVEELGMEFVRVPFREPESLNDEVFDEIRAILNEANRTVLLHCGSASRVGAVWIPWRVLDGGLSFEEAAAEAKEIGLRTPAYEERARDYVERNSGS